MQNRKNVSRLSIVLLTVLLVTMPLRAQVIIGDNSKDPHKFSLLEIVAKSAGGLRLPQLTDAQCAALKTFFTSGTTSASDKAAAEGLVVYNTDVHCLFYWGDGDWVSACNETPDPQPDPQTCTSPVIVHTSETSQKIDVGASAMMSVTATGTGPLFYQWYSGVAGNESYPVEVAQTNSYGPTPVSASTYYYWCKVSNSCGTTNSEQFTVETACPPVPAQPGAIAGPVYVNRKATNSLTYSVGAVAGAASYTWALPSGWTGRSTTNSITVTLSETATIGTGAISVWAENGCSSSAASTLDVVTIVTACGAFIASGVWKEFMCWNLGADYSAVPFTPSQAINGDYYQWGSKDPVATVYTDPGSISPWNSTVTPSSDPYYGSGGSVYNESMLTSTAKSSTDPCPDGYRVPNQSEWAGVMNTTLNARTNYPTGETWSETSGGWYGAKFGDLLFLPAAGYRNASDGTLTDRGISGGYWTSTLYMGTSAAFYVSISSTSGDVINAERNFGLSVRCIAE